MSKHEEEIQSAPTFRYAILFVIIIMLMAGAVVSIVFLRKPSLFPVENVIVRGQIAPADQMQLQHIIKPAVQVGFFNLNLPALQASIQQMPNISQAEITRVWPSTVVVTLGEQKPVARWNDDQVLNSYGEVFQMPIDKKMNNSLPKFVGQEAYAVQMLSYYQQINELLQPLKLHVTSVRLKSGGFLVVGLSNRMQLHLGHSHILKRIKRFIAIYPKVFASTTRRAKEVDLQYDSGMAVKWY